MANKNTNETTSEPQRTINGSPEEMSNRYVVVREGYRVSAKEYETPDDPACVSEIEFWDRVAQNHSYGERVEAVLYDSKRHRVW